MSKAVLVKAYVALMLLLALTFGLSLVDLGRLGLVAALAIGAAKAALVLVFFMELASASRLVSLFAGLGFYWLVIMMGMTLADYISRGPQ